MAKDKTVIGITGKPIPKPRTAKQQYELEKKRRMEKHLGKNVGGVQYSSDVTPYYNPRARTFREFVEIAEAVSDSDRALARSGLLSKRADDLQKEIDAVTSGKKTKTQTATRTARRIKRSELSSIVKEEDSIEEAKVDEKLPEHERATARDKRSEYADLPGSGARRSRRIAHRERDDRNKDLADLRKGKKKDSAYHSYLP
jgi:hypothetical protein